MESPIKNCTDSKSKTWADSDGFILRVLYRRCFILTRMYKTSEYRLQIYPLQLFCGSFEKPPSAAHTVNYFQWPGSVTSLSFVSNCTVEKVITSQPVLYHLPFKIKDKSSKTERDFCNFKPNRQASIK